jgi:hypothetical protein
MELLNKKCSIPFFGKMDIDCSYTSPGLSVFNEKLFTTNSVGYYTTLNMGTHSLPYPKLTNSLGFMGTIRLLFQREGSQKIAYEYVKSFNNLTDWPRTVICILKHN